MSAVSGANSASKSVTRPEFSSKATKSAIAPLAVTSANTPVLVVAVVKPRVLLKNLSTPLYPIKNWRPPSTNFAVKVLVWWSFVGSVGS